MKKVPLKIKDEYYELAQIVEVTMAKSTDEALNLILFYGISKAREEIKKRKSKKLTEK
ncbi:VapB-type antitoxin [Sulfolobus sp. S-194]|uniref:VapB-type antitoxin n=1 Tax=Sulfolobus sp. S-194 TaxID=2512240 RepID=UPI00143728AF|nr:VapB-type antitoxin [Sulfolobus sp. S-194]QIW22824.1 VapB-type antitoxin [Sulfolobus sp. S-194]